MHKKILKSTIFIVTVSLLVPGVLLTAGNSSASPLSPTPTFHYHVSIEIRNNQSYATPAPYDEEVVVNSSSFSYYENANLSNIWFSYPNGTVVNSWMQSGNSTADSNTTYWLKLDQSIPSGGSIQVYMNFLPKGSIAFNGNSTGEAPELSTSYAQYDNGAHVFSFYDNFSGTSLSNALWTNSGGITVNDGLNITGANQIISTRTFSYPSYVEAYGIIAPDSFNDNVTYFLGGVGFTQNNIANSPVMTSGWAENNTNGPGMSIWTANGVVHTYNYSKKIDSYRPHVYGIGFINDSYTTGLIDGNIANYTTLKLNAASSTQLNAMIGFQSGNHPLYDSFSWIFVRNSLSTGQVNLPYTIGLQAYTVTFTPVGLPAGADWSISVNGTAYPSNSGSISMNLLNGTYHAVIASSDGYMAYPDTLTFGVTGYSFTIYPGFESPYNQTFIRAKSTLSEGLTLAQNGYEQNVTVPGGPYLISSIALDQKANILFATLPNMGKIAARNLTDGVVSYINAGPALMSLYFDSNSNLLYSTSYGTGGNLSVINPTTLQIIKNVSLPWTDKAVSSIVPGGSSGQIYVISLNLSMRYYPVNIEVLNNDGTFVSNVTMGHLNDTIYYSTRGAEQINGEVLIANQTGMWSFNPLTGGAVFTQAPKGFNPGGVVQYAGGDSYLVGDTNYSNVPNMFYNSSTRTFSPGLKQVGAPVSGAYNPVTGIQYVQYVTTTAVSGGMAAINTRNSTTVSAPYPTWSQSTIFDKNNGNIYSSDNPFYVGPSYFVHVMGTSRVYSLEVSATGLPHGTSWSAKLNGNVMTTNSGSLTQYAINGTSISLSPLNSSLYYTDNAPGTYVVNGANVDVSVAYHHWAYISGNFTQTGINISVNGVSLGTDITSFNESVPAGTYSVVITEAGHKTVYDNFTLQPGQAYNASATLQKLNANSPSGLSPGDIYIVAGVVAAVAVVSGTLLYMRRRVRP